MHKNTTVDSESVCFRKNIHGIYSSHSSLQKKKEQMIHLREHHEKRLTDTERLQNFNLHNDGSSSIKVRALCGPNRSRIIKRTRYTRWIFPCVNEMAVEMNDSSDWGESVCCQGIGSSSIISQKVVSCIACDRMSKNVKQRNWEACSYLGEFN